MIKPEPNKIALAGLLDQAAEREASRIATRLRAGEFNEMDGPLAAPITTLVYVLEAAGYPELAKRARKGDFDD